jgi:hypothetical protein
VLDVLNSKNLTDAGPVDLINADSDDEAELLPAGAPLPAEGGCWARAMLAAAVWQRASIIRLCL